MKFRHHRGSLEESLKTTIECNSIEELSKILEETHDHEIKSIKVKYYCHDSRIGKDLYMVTCSTGENETSWVAGFLFDPTEEVINLALKNIWDKS